jgi:hypothetical protein
MAWYTEGTISLVQNSKVATGTGTKFLANTRYGDILFVNGEVYEIMGAVNDLQLNLVKQYTGPTQLEQPYSLIRNMTNASNYDLMRAIDEMLGERNTQLNQFTVWSSGTVNGGPEGDGRYPLTNRFGVTQLVYCPAKMAQLSGTQNQIDLTQIQTDITNIQDLLSDYGTLEAKLNALVGVDLAKLGGQPKNAKLTQISAIEMKLNQVLVASGEETFTVMDISDRGKALIAAQTAAEMRSVMGVATGGTGSGNSGSGGVPGRRVAILGTSLCQLCNYGTATEISMTNRSWIGWAAVLTNNKIMTPVWYDRGLYPGWEVSDHVGDPRGFRGLNAGVSSDHADNIFDRASYLVANVDCEFVVMDSGINDIGDNSLTSDAISALREKTVDYLLANGKTVIMLTLLSPAATYYPIGSTQRRKMERVNNRAREFALQRKNMYLFDWTEYMMDFNDPNGQPKPLHSVDGLHFAPRGAFAVGKGLAKLFSTFLPDAPRVVWSPEDIYDSVLAPQGNLMTNSFCYGQSGTLDAGATGNVANGMRGGINSGDGSAFYEKLARADGRGQWQQITITPGTTDTQALFRVTDITHGLPEGTWVQGSVELECDAWEYWAGINLQMRDLAAGGLTSHALKSYSGFPMPAEAWSGTIMTPAFQVKAGGQLRWRFEATALGNAVGKGVVRVGAVGLRVTIDPKIIVNAR